MASGMLRCAISSVKDKTPSQSSRSCQLRRWGQEILDKSAQGEAETAAFDRFSEQLIHCMRERIQVVTKGLKLNSSKRTKIWSEFHRIRLDASGPMRSLWKELLTKLGIKGTEADPLLEQSVYNEIFTILVSEYFTSQSAHSNESDTTPVELTSDELNAMRYACGYVPRSLLKKYEIKCGDMYSQYVQCLGDMAVEGEGDDILTYTRKWFDQVNRGGLFPINDNTFSFFVEIEKCVRMVLPKHMVRGEADKASFKKSVLDVIVKNESVQFYWTLLSQDIENLENSEALLTEIVHLWVTIRGFSMAASWMEEYKINTRKTTQKSTGLRKSISGSTS